MTKNKCRLQREVHRTLEIAQTLMQRVVLLYSYAFVAKKGRPTNFLKLEFDKITFDSHGTGVKNNYNYPNYFFYFLVIKDIFKLKCR